MKPGDLVGILVPCGGGPVAIGSQASVTAALGSLWSSCEGKEGKKRIVVF